MDALPPWYTEDIAAVRAHVKAVESQALAVRSTGLRLLNLRDRKAHEVETFPSYDAFCQHHFDFGAEMAGRYASVVRRYAEAELVGCRLGVNALHAIRAVHPPHRAMLLELGTERSPQELLRAAAAAEGLEGAQARAVIKDALREEQQGRKRGGAGGGRSRKKNIPLPERIEIIDRLMERMLGHVVLAEQQIAQGEPVPFDLATAIHLKRSVVEKGLRVIAGERRAAPRPESEPEPEHGGAHAHAHVDEDVHVHVDEVPLTVQEEPPQAEEPPPQAEEPPPQAEAPPPVPAFVEPREPVLREGQFLLRVPYPLLCEPGITALERVSCELITLLLFMRDTIERALRIGEVYPVCDQLQWLVGDAYSTYIAERNEFLPFLAESSQACQAERAEQGIPEGQETWPLPMTPAPSGVTLAYVVLNQVELAHEHDELRDLLGIEERPSGATSLLLRLLAVLRRFSGQFIQWVTLRVRKELCDPWVLYQLEVLLKDVGVWINMLRCQCDEGFQRRERVQAVLRAERERQGAHLMSLEDQMIILGEGMAVNQWVKVGRAPDGRPVSISLSSGQFLILIGPQGSGKTHQAVLVSEGRMLQLEGLARTTASGRVIRFAVDWHSDKNRHPMLLGMSSNPYRQHWDFLRRSYQIDFSNAAFERATLLCNPESEAQLAEKYADLRERGLRLVPALLHKSEWGSLGYSLLLGGGDVSAANRTAGKALIHAVLGYHGEDLGPDKLLQELRRGKMDGRTLGLMERLIPIMRRYTTEQQHLIDVLDEEAPVFGIFESKVVNRDILVPYQVAAMNALSRPLRGNQGDPQRWFILDELIKLVANPAVVDFLTELGAEVRHRPISALGAAQSFAALPQVFFALATIVGVTGVANQAEYELGCKLVPGLKGWRFAEVLDLHDHEVLLTAKRCTDKAVTQRAVRVAVRPSCIDAGGETLREDEEDAA